MTPQEQALVDELFDRLASVENAPRDPEAERVIANGLRRAPHAVYALVQTALVQDEALKRANARMEELEAQLGGGPQVQQQGSFLDSMREAVLGKREPRGSVPSVRSPAAQTAPMGPPPYEQGHGYPPQMPTGPAFGSGGSFLGTTTSRSARTASKPAPWAPARSSSSARRPECRSRSRPGTSTGAEFPA